jgi:DNA-binding LytR/AlgR family response regulator
MRVIVVDDEELARRHLAKMLGDLQVDVVAEGESGAEVANLIAQHRPDVVFMDIQMPDMTGLQAADVLNSTQDAPLLVFVTGYSEHALEAFDANATDYLVKPVSIDRLEQTINRLQKSLDRLTPEVKPSEPEDNLVRRIPIRSDYAIKLLKIDDIECAVSKEKRVLIRSKGIDHRSQYTLTQLEELLPKEDFMRIHMSAIVRLDLVESVNFLGNHTYSVTLTGGLVLPIGRTFYSDVQRRLGLV